MALETPEAALEPGSGDSPATDQAPVAAPEQAPAKPAAPTIADPRFNREFTQRSQAISSIRDELGLPPNATPTEVAEAVKALKAQAEAPAPPDVGEDEALNDPRYIELLRRASEAEWTIARAEYSDVADAARDFLAFARKEQHPGRLTAKMYELLGRFAAPPGEAAGEAAAPPAGEPLPAAGSDAGLGASEDERLTARQLDQTTLEEFKGTGNVAGFLKKIGLVREAGS